jgi:uncharacterized protein YpmB
MTRLSWIVLIALVVVGIGWPTGSQADEVSIDQVPPAVRATIERETRGGRIKEIERERKNGRIVYEVEFVRDGKEREIHVDSDGKVLKRDD